jgi:hypothetical protein
MGGRYVKGVRGLRKKEKKRQQLADMLEVEENKSLNDHIVSVLAGKLGLAESRLAHALKHWGIKERAYKRREEKWALEKNMLESKLERFENPVKKRD